MSKDPNLQQETYMPQQQSQPQQTHVQVLIHSKKFLYSMVAFGIALVIAVIAFTAFTGETAGKTTIAAGFVFLIGCFLLSTAVSDAFYDTWKNRHSILLLLIGGALLGAVMYPMILDQGEMWSLALSPIPFVVLFVGLCTYRKHGRF